MVRSKSKYNFWNILYELLVKGVSFFSFLFKAKEKNLFIRQERFQDERNIQPVFIIGPPRSGSTFLYQLITNLYDVKYFDNLVDIFHKFPLVGLWLSDRIFNDKPHNCYKSKHGSTLLFGLHAPSECGNYWYRFLPKKKYYADENGLNQKSKNQIKKEISVILNRYKKPFVIKNLSNSLRLKLIYDLFPEAKIIVIDRSDEDILRSIMKVREKNGTSSDELWSVAPPELFDRKYDSVREMVNEQIKVIRQYIENDIKLFNKDNVLRLRYEDIRSGLEDDFEKSLRHFLKVDRREGDYNPSKVR